MKINNNRKLIPGIISLFIIAGMAFSTFATDVDMAAFVRKDEHKTKYFEVDFRINSIDADLERLYKWTCTNVKSFGGATGSLDLSVSAYINPFVYGSTNSDYHENVNPIADLSEEGYLRFNTGRIINDFGDHSKVNYMRYEIPASQCIWKDGVVPAPNCTFIINSRRDWANSTSYSSNVSFHSIEMIMGPFTKFPKITATGDNAGFLVAFPNVFLYTNRTWSTSIGIYYQKDTLTQPTTWNTVSGSNTGMRINYQLDGATERPSFPPQTTDEFINAPDKRFSNMRKNFLCFYNTAPTTDFSTMTNVWLRYVYSSSGTDDDKDISLDNFTLTSWNYNK